MTLGWVADGSVDSIRRALSMVAPDLADDAIALREGLGESDPQWWSSSALVGGEAVVKFAWSRPAAERLWNEAQILRTFADRQVELRLPPVVAVADDPVLVVTRFVAGRPLTIEMVRSADRAEVEEIGAELASFLTNMHRPETLASARRAISWFPTPPQPATTEELRTRFGAWIRTDQQRHLLFWCDWADEVLARPGGAVLVHGDLHGHNQLWHPDRLQLRAVVDFETCSVADLEYDFRCLPAEGGPDLALLTATASHYRRLSGTDVALDRVMAWHIRASLGDALWRSEAGVHLPGGGTPSEWMDAINARMDAFGMRA